MNGLNSKQYANLIESIKNEHIADEATIRKLVYIISSPENIFGIQSLEQLKKFDRLQYCEKIKSGELETEYTKGLTELDKLKFCVLEKKYGQSLEECKRLLVRYGKDLDKFEIQDENDIKIKAYLEALRNILTTNDKSVLEDLYNSPGVLEENYLFSNIIESKIRGFFVRQYNKELYKIDKDKKIEIDIPSADGLELYDTGEEFKLVITSLGAYSRYNSKANFEQEWNRKQFASHGFCTSLIANNSIATARIEHLVLGFNNFVENSLLLSAPWDVRFN